MEESKDMQEQPTEMQVQEEQAQANTANSTEATQSPEARIAELEVQLAQAKQEAAENWNKYLRERADMENFRKRQERIMGDRVQRQKKELFQKILAVMDNVERAPAYQDTMDKQGLQQALRMLMWQLNEV